MLVHFSGISWVFFNDDRVQGDGPTTAIQPTARTAAVVVDEIHQRSTSDVHDVCRSYMIKIPLF